MKKSGLTLMILVVSLALITLAPFGVAKAQPAKYLKIGGNYGLTGVAASILIPSKRLLDLEVEKINKEGGFMVGGQRYLIELIWEDNGYTSERSVANAIKLINRDNVKFMFNIGAPGLAQTSVTEPAKVLSFLSSSSDNALLNKRYSLRLYPIIPMNILTIMDYISKNLPEVKRVCLLYKNDSTGVVSAEVLPKLSAHYGMEFIGYELYDKKTRDFYPLLSRMLPQKPDLIVTDATTPGALVHKQALEKGYKGYFMIPTVGADSVWAKLGDTIRDGCSFGPIVDVESDVAPKRIKELRDLYAKKYDPSDPLDVAYLYNCYLDLVIKAVQKAGTVDDTDKIRDIMVKNTWDLPWGRTVFVGKEIWGVDGQGIMPLFVSTWIGSKKQIKLLKVIPPDDVYPLYLKMFGKK
ncbi:MAG: ABC transporter substrate-binding protein [Pseudomonadota bacterium]